MDEELDENINNIIILNDENGNEVLSLSVWERAYGFFSVGMSIFVIYCVAMMSYYIYLSTVL